MKEIIKLKNKIKSIDGFLSFIKEVSNLEGGNDLVYNLIKTIENTFNEVEKVFDFSDRDSLEFELICNLDELKRDLIDLSGKLEAEWKESQEQYEQDCLEIGNQFWRDLYSDGSAGDM